MPADSIDLLAHPELAVCEALGELVQPGDRRNVRERLPPRDLPQREQRKRELRHVAGLSAAVDAHLAQVEEHPVLELALIDVAADLRLVRGEVLGRALGVEDEAVGDEIVRGEVRLEATATELREVRVGREAEHALHQLGEQRLGQ